MKHRLQILAVALLVAIGTVSCQRTLGTRQRTQCFNEFDLGTILRKLSAKGLQCDGSYSTDSSGGSLSREYSGYRKASSLECQVLDESSGFDQAAFMQALKSEVELLIKGTGAKVGGTANNSSNISCGYSDGDRHGWIEVFAMTTDGKRYRFSYVIHEFMRN